MSEQAHTWITPHGNPITILTRDDTADAALVDGLLNGDEYRLKDIGQLEGICLDIGAHIGTISLACLADFPFTTWIAVEPIPENADLIRRSGDSWLRQSRLLVVEAAAVGPADPEVVEVSYDYTSHAGTEDSYVHQNRYVGGMWREGYEGKRLEVPTVTLRDLAARYAPNGITLLKIDAEGAEYAFLSDGLELVAGVIGEWHDGGPERITRLLEDTHILEVLEDHGGTGIFRAWRKP